MEKTKTRIFRLDGDCLEVTYRYDEKLNMYFGEYPDFIQEPRYTPNGRPWTNVPYDECIYANEKYPDCGDCEFLKKEKEDDLIGICTNDAKRR